MRTSSLVVTGRVIGALMLRDIQTRFGARSANYVVAILWPLGHIVMLISLYTITGRAAPVSGGAARFFATGLVPFVMFNYTSRMLMLSVLMNRPLLGLPIIKLSDVIMARALLETVTSFMVISIFACILYAFDVDIVPHDPQTAVFALAATLLMSLGMGFLNSVIVIMVPVWIIGYVLIMIVFYLTSGVVFLPDQLPEKYQYILSWNPLMQSIAWFRSAFYPGMGAHIIDRQYLLIFGLVALGLGLAGERFLRRWLLSM